MGDYADDAIDQALDEMLDPPKYVGWSSRHLVMEVDEDGPTPEGIGQWSTASKKALNLNETKEDKHMAEKQEATRLTTPYFRVSFPSVFTARAVVEGQDKKFSIAMLFPKVFTPEWCAQFKTTPEEQTRLLNAMKQAVNEAAKAKFGPEPAKWPKGLLSPWHDGAKETKDYDGYDQNTIWCSASSKIKPGLVDAKMNPIIEPNEFYGGCYARATVTVFDYDNVKKGVSFGLRNIQKVKDGEPFGGASKPEDDFAAIETPTADGAGAGAQEQKQAAPAGAAPGFDI
jgi:hypothetical protein